MIRAAMIFAVIGIVLVAWILREAKDGRHG